MWLHRKARRGLLVDLEPVQAKLLESICSGLTISSEELRVSGALEVPAKPKKGSKKPDGPSLFDFAEGVPE